MGRMGLDGKAVSNNGTENAEHLAPLLMPTLDEIVGPEIKPLEAAGVPDARQYSIPKVKAVNPHRANPSEKVRQIQALQIEASILREKAKALLSEKIKLPEDDFQATKDDIDLRVLEMKTQVALYEEMVEEIEFSIATF